MSARQACQLPPVSASFLRLAAPPPHLLPHICPSVCCRSPPTWTAPLGKACWPLYPWYLEQGTSPLRKVITSKERDLG